MLWAWPSGLAAAVVGAATKEAAVAMVAVAVVAVTATEALVVAAVAATATIEALTGTHLGLVAAHEYRFRKVLCLV